MEQNQLAGYTSEELTSILVVAVIVAVTTWYQTSVNQSATSAVIAGLLALIVMAIGVRVFP